MNPLAGDDAVDLWTAGVSLQRQTHGKNNPYGRDQRRQDCCADGGVGLQELRVADSKEAECKKTFCRYLLVH